MQDFTTDNADAVKAPDADGEIVMHLNGETDIVILTEHDVDRMKAMYTGDEIE